MRPTKPVAKPDWMPKRIHQILMLFGDFRFVISGLVTIILIGACSSPAEPTAENELITETTFMTAEDADELDYPRSELLGGQTTIYNTTPNAFGQPAPGLTNEEERLFFVGNSFFNQNWVTAPASTTARDGLGPMFNARSCASCHFKDGRGRPPEFDGESPTGFLVRLSIPGTDLTYGTIPDPNYGGQFQTESTLEVVAEGSVRIVYTEIEGEFADGTPYTLRKPAYVFEDLAYGEFDSEILTSPRVANQIIGLGLLEAVPEETLLTLADPTDTDGDGISGRPNYVWNVAESQMQIGRFGWKANQPNLLQQSAGAFNGDLGITTGIFPEQSCTSVQEDCIASIHGGGPPDGAPEIIDEDLLKVTLYTATLAVPARRNFDDPQTNWGEALFFEANCQSCHTPELETGIHPTIPALSNQTIYPYTDLLLHDMGSELTDGRPDFQATGSEWRTPPLWGIGLIETVNGHTYFLHDGRARSIMEAILWHGGEAKASRDVVLEMNADEREALIAFLESL